MTFCFFAAQYLPTVGGVERYTFNLARTLIQSGHEAIVVTSALRGLPAIETDENGIKIYRMPSHLFLNGRLPVICRNADLRRQAGLLAKEQIDRVVVNTRFYSLSLFGAKFAKQHALPCIVIEHGSAHLTLGSRAADLAVQIYEHVFIRLVRHQCAAFYGVSAAAVTFLHHFGVTAKGTLHNAVNPCDMVQQKDTPRWRTQLQLPEGAVLVCFAGRLIPEKGVEQLCAAMCTIVQENPQVYLALAGDGALRAQLESMAPQHTFFLGQLPYEQVIALLHAGDIFCLPTVSEGFATSLLEAAACRCYIISTRVGGAVELLLDESYGAILENNTQQEIAAAVLQAAGNADVRAAATKKCYTHMTENFTWDKISAQLIQLPWSEYVK